MDFDSALSSAVKFAAHWMQTAGGHIATMSGHGDVEVKLTITRGLVMVRMPNIGHRQWTYSPREQANDG